MSVRACLLHRIARAVFKPRANDAAWWLHAHGQLVSTTLAIAGTTAYPDNVRQLAVEVCLTLAQHAGPMVRKLRGQMCVVGRVLRLWCTACACVRARVAVCSRCNAAVSPLRPCLCPPLAHFATSALGRFLKTILPVLFGMMLEQRACDTAEWDSKDEPANRPCTNFNVGREGLQRVGQVRGDGWGGGEEAAARVHDEPEATRAAAV